MGIFNASFFLGSIILLYLGSFLLLAIFRIVTGISIQRLGYLCLRRVVLTPREGLRIEIKTLGLSIHRPTFAQPTWITLRLEGCRLILDLSALLRDDELPMTKCPPCSAPGTVNAPKSILRSRRKGDGDVSQSKAWRRLTKAKEWLKNVHRKVRWLRLVDVLARGSVISILNVGHFDIGTFIMMIDTRQKTINRGRLSQHSRFSGSERRPAEWMLTIKGILYTPINGQSAEIVDIATVSIHGHLYKDRPGLRDTSITIKVTRTHIPLDEYASSMQKIRDRKSIGATKKIHTADCKGDDRSRDYAKEADDLAQTVSESKALLRSILHGVQDLQLAISSVNITRSMRNETASTCLNVLVNEFDLDLHRLDSESPAHRMYFAPTDVAHQALLAAISISVDLHDESNYARKAGRLLYIPMATTTVKTTLPSKSVSFSEYGNVMEKNANIVFANLVITSPSIDLDPLLMPRILALISHRQSHHQQQQSSLKELPHWSREHLRQLLPKANIKISVQEPVIRTILPPVTEDQSDGEIYDLLIFSISSVDLDIESTHLDTDQLNYTINSTFRLINQKMYYQTSLGEKYKVVSADALESTLKLVASPNVAIILTGNLRKLAIHLVKPEIIIGVRQISKQLRNRAWNKRLESSRKMALQDFDFLRPMPKWLIEGFFQGSDFTLEIAGVDKDISARARGILLRLESWTLKYESHREASHLKNRTRISDKTTIHSDDKFAQSVRHSPAQNTDSQLESTNGRRATFHLRSLQAYALIDLEELETDAFLVLPRFEAAFSTPSDFEGPMFHVNVFMKFLGIDYSLYRYYAIGVANDVLRKAFSKDVPENLRPGRGDDNKIQAQVPSSNPSAIIPQVATIDVRAELIQIKATMAADPRVMLQIYALEAGQHRWAQPFLRSVLVRLCAVAPQLKTAWTRIASLKSVRMDLRELKKKRCGQMISEKSLDIATDYSRWAVPHQMVLHEIFDNFVNVFKVTAQLDRRFKTGRNDYILKKMPEGPKQGPRISFRCKTMLLDFEDGAFDWKLGMIHRIGIIEQKQRIAREEAFHAKARNVEKSQSSRHHTKSRCTSAGAEKTKDKRRKFSERIQSSSDSEGIQDNRGRAPPSSKSDKHVIRYNPDGKCTMNSRASISSTTAWDKLQRHNAQSWKKRIDRAYHLQNRSMQEVRSDFWASDEVPVEANNERILTMPERPSLMALMLSELHLVIDKPSFPVRDYPKFLHKVGKGMPLDMEYSLLIPVGLHIDMGEMRLTLRDYPLPLLHVPALKASQPTRHPSFSLRTDFVIAEEFRGDTSSRDVAVQVIPADKMSHEECAKGFAINVCRTVSPVKTYSDIQISIGTSAPTVLTWGTSLQPAIQDMMMVFENFTKPQLDPSERVGFWDKIRLSAHSRVKIDWHAGGDVHLNLKGSRDPYCVTGHGSGFVMVWRKNVCWQIHQDDDPTKFMTVDSGEYVLAIPDFSRQVKENMSFYNDGGKNPNHFNVTDSAFFKKTVMKLEGEVRWIAGLVFEGKRGVKSRSFAFRPHYDVALRDPFKAQQLQDKTYDAFEGFRSEYIHMSVAVFAPLERVWSTTNSTPSKSYNSVHLTPKFFTHFFDWWSTFNGSLSLPVRQGALFPGIEKSSKKFGRHLATIKYNLCLAPLFLAHVYKHKDLEEYGSDAVSATGLKLRLDSFMLDVHQRREYFAYQHSGRGRQIKTSVMKMNQAQLDFLTADLRAISASIKGTDVRDVQNISEERLALLNQVGATADLSKFTIPDQDFRWVDMDDFNELDWILPAESNPETKILPLAYAPHFTYFRQTDHPEGGAPGPARSSDFGDEPTHFCIMSQDNDPRKVQCQLFESRLEKLHEQLDAHQRDLGEQELLVIRDSSKDPTHASRYEELKRRHLILQKKRLLLARMVNRLRYAIEHNKGWNTSDFKRDEDDEDSEDLEARDQTQNMEVSPQRSSTNNFNNRFIIHNVQLKWNNDLRNIILRYVHQVSQRRGFVYYLSRRAVKFLSDIVKEQSRSKDPTPSERSFSYSESNDTSHQSESSSEKDTGETEIDDLIQVLLEDGNKEVAADDGSTANKYDAERSLNESTQPEMEQELVPVNTYLVHLIAPQIQLQSEKNPKSVLLITAKNMHLRVVQIMDRDRLSDDVSGLLRRDISVNMDSAQFFVTHFQLLREYQNLSLGTSYGAAKGTIWPPWVPFEVNFDFDFNPFGWQRVVSKTSASLMYEKYNTLRVQYNDGQAEGSNRRHHAQNASSKVDHLRMNFPHIRATCDSSQYYTLYAIVVDLLLYSEPLEKVRNERLEKIMLVSDFSDLRGAPRVVEDLQARIRQLQEIKLHFQMHQRRLDKQGWQDHLAVEQDLTSCEDELFFMMKAITASQRKSEERTEGTHANEVLRLQLSADEIVWHLMKQESDPLIEIQLYKAHYTRHDISDGSNHNTVEIGHLHGLNLLPNAIYPEMLGPYLESGRKVLDDKETGMLTVNWRSLEAIAGIPVLDQFEVDLYPLKIQLEREIGQKVFEYIFPGAKGKEKSIRRGPASLVNSIDIDPESPGASQQSLSTQAPMTKAKSENSSSAYDPSSQARLRATMQYPEKDDKPAQAAKAKSRVSDDRDDQNRSVLPRKAAMENQSLRPDHHLQRRSGSHDSTAQSVASMTSPSIPESVADRHKSSQVYLQKKPSLNRTNGLTAETSKDKDQDKEASRATDDLSLMLTRASNYMTLAHVRIPSVVLCLSYKGRDERNLEDVHDFVFRMPTLEYRNKTWSNLDLALRLKKDVMRALISHTGAIIGNKFSHHRPSRQQQRRLRELAMSNSILPNRVGILNSGSYESVHHISPSSAGSSVAPLPQSGHEFNSSVSLGNGSLDDNSEEHDRQSHPVSEELATPSIPRTDGDISNVASLRGRLARRLTTDFGISKKFNESSRTPEKGRYIEEEVDNKSTPESSKKSVIGLGKKMISPFSH